jgi:hypothetical protein
MPYRKRHMPMPFRALKICSAGEPDMAYMAVLALPSTPACSRFQHKNGKINNRAAVSMTCRACYTISWRRKQQAAWMLVKIGGAQNELSLPAA